MQRQRVILHGDKSLKIRHTESQSSTMVQRALSLEVVEEGSADVEKIRSSCHQCRQSVCLSTASLFCFVHR